VRGAIDAGATELVPSIGAWAHADAASTPTP
jgi:hypothetical protein